MIWPTRAPWRTIPTGSTRSAPSGWPRPTTQRPRASNPGEYVLFHTAYNEMEGTKDADGKTVKGEAKSDHVREWLEDFSGLTDEQRAFLWGTVYTSEW